MCVCMYVCVYECVGLYVCASLGGGDGAGAVMCMMCVCVRVCVYACVYMCMCVYVCVQWSCVVYIGKKLERVRNNACVCTYACVCACVHEISTYNRQEDRTDAGEGFELEDRFKNPKEAQCFKAVYVYVNV